MHVIHNCSLKFFYFNKNINYCIRFLNIFRSFVPPARDEESETQRKAHAKRVRETRRSTQGVTLDEIKSAEELVKKKTSNATSANNMSNNSNIDNTSSENSSGVSRFVNLLKIYNQSDIYHCSEMNDHVIVSIRQEYISKVMFYLHE